VGVYDSSVAMATRLIAAKGQSCSWQQTAIVVPNEEQPWLPTKGAVTEYLVTIAFLPASSLLAKLFAGSNIAQGGTRGLMAAVDFTPNVADIVLRGGRSIGLKAVDQLNVNGEVILWKLEFKA
jgi:hypothetical protein